MPAGFSSAAVTAAASAAGSVVTAGVAGGAVVTGAAASTGLGAGTVAAVAGGAAVVAGGTAVAVGSDAPTPAPVSTPTPSAFQRFYGAYTIQWAYVPPSDSGCAGAGTHVVTLAGNADGSGFTFQPRQDAAREPGTISPDGVFRTESTNAVWATDGQTNGATISGRSSSNLCFAQFSQGFRTYQ